MYNQKGECLNYSMMAENDFVGVLLLDFQNSIFFLICFLDSVGNRKNFNFFLCEVKDVFILIFLYIEEEDDVFSSIVEVYKGVFGVCFKLLLNVIVLYCRLI